MAPVGGTMCAASPAITRLPWRIGVNTKLRIAVMPRSRIGPVLNENPSPVGSRVSNSDQMRSSDHSSMRSSAGTCRYNRVIVGERML